MRGLLATIMLLSALLIACASRRQAEQEVQHPTVEVKTFSRFSIYPGIPSNHYKTLVYRVIIEVKHSEPLLPHRLLCDSVAIEVPSFTVNGLQFKDAGVAWHQAPVQLEFEVYRMIWHDASQVREEDRDGVVLSTPLAEGEHHLELTWGAHRHRVALGEPEELEPVHSP
jgi:hypothetical protein